MANLSDVFQSVKVDCLQHEGFLAEVQRLRGRVYLNDGAIEARQLSADGRFVHPHDESSWQLLVTDSMGQVSGCLRYRLADEAPFDDLDIAQSALACSDKWGRRLQRAVEAQKAEAQRREIKFAELGGWALVEEMRGSRLALGMALTVFALGQLLGGAVATTTATTRHRSSTILRKVGGTGLVTDGLELPAYYDPRYRCEMEILGFDAHRPNPKYKVWVDECRRHLANLTVICAEFVYPGLKYLGVPAADRVPRYARQRFTLDHNQTTADW
jgi:hypothetical protein